ncbi:hypothetical protein CI610_02734 [invertebrate metagenome]|uniref:Uncharacterized protein n=1 Tax=invertebrate metagenome TaxID=1711999 RepID=A0A2H9T536_9ZZZZ
MIGLISSESRQVALLMIGLISSESRQVALLMIGLILTSSNKCLREYRDTVDVLADV